MQNQGMQNTRKDNEEAPITAKPELEAPDPGRTGVKRPAECPKQAPLAENDNVQFKLDYSEEKLENGLTVYLMEQHEVPLIHVSAVFPAGAVKDNGQYGLASLTAEGLLLGTRNYSKEQMEEKLDFLGASYSTRAGEETASISLSFLNTHQETVFPILKEIITQPVFDQTEFEKRKKRLLLEFNFDELNLNRVQLWVYGFNQRAFRSYEKAVFTHEGTARQGIYREGQYHDLHLMAVLREEWHNKTG